MKSTKRVIQDFLGYFPIEYRQGLDYIKLKNFLEKSQFWNNDKILDWQLKNLKKILIDAYNYTDGYRQLYDESNVHPNDLKSLSDIKFFPTVNKHLIRNNLDSFTSKKYNKNKYFLCSTSGSSGIPFSFYNLKRDRFEYSFMFTLWKWFGHDPNKLTAVLKGGFGDNPSELYKLDRYYNSLFLSTSQLSKETLPFYLDLIKKYNIKILRALPSSLYVLCNLLKNINKSKYPNFDIISISSENNYEWQFKLFKTTFPKARIFSWYGHAEKTVLAPYCEHSNKYHLWPFYGYSEILNDDKKEVEINNIGKLYGTSFFSKATYFIRYDTGDIVEKGKKNCKKCGRNFQLINKVQGREQEYVVTKNGRLVSATVLNILDQTYDSFEQFQFFQKQKGELIFKYENSVILSEKEKNNLIKRIKNRIGNDIEIKLDSVNKINKTTSQKYLFLDQRIKI